MDFDPTPRHLEVQSLARKLAAEVLSPRAELLDREGGFPRETLQALAEAGLLAVNIPREHGGLAAGAVSYALAVMELARACASTTVALCVSNMVAEVVMRFGTPDQIRDHVPRLADGSYTVGAFALSEAGAGSDPGGMRTRARKTDRGWVIDGSKLWITSGTDAGLFVVWARTNDAAGPRGISAFLVRGDTPGLVRGKPEHKLGLRGSTTTAIDFHGCEVGDDALLDEEGRGFRVAMMALDGGRIGIASQALGLGTAALERACEWARGAQRLGGPAREQQAVQWLLADAATELDAARLLTLRAAWLKERGQPFTREASIAKLWASERAWATCNRALQAMGEDGLAPARGVERFWRDVRVTMIYEGTSEVQRIVIARELERRFEGA
jgi:alkylation response protein AidB-like acyl-CoA dehydrogenase